jgi:hypothetical protein
MNKVFLLLLPVLLIAWCTNAPTSQKVDEFIESTNTEVIQEVINTWSQDIDNTLWSIENDDDNCKNYGDNLSTCTPSVCNITSMFWTALWENKLTKTIKWIEWWLCIVEDTIPQNNQIIVCKYNEQERQAVAKYFKKSYAMTVEGTEDLDISSEDENPMQQAMNNWSCVVSNS